MIVLSIEHVDGVPWWKAPRPRRLFHRHSIQTVAVCDGGYEVHRCTCGYLRYSDDGAGWTERGKPRFRGLL